MVEGVAVTEVEGTCRKVGMGVVAVVATATPTSPKMEVADALTLLQVRGTEEACILA